MFLQRCKRSVLLILVTLWTGICIGGASQSSVDVNDAFYDKIISVKQGWGELGINVAAFAAPKSGMPLQVKDHVFSTGLGSHAPGEIIVDLNGEYAAFEAKVGVQRQSDNSGSVVFKVLVDGNECFNSGIMRQTDEAQSVHVPVIGASELHLVVTDAGDGMTCDMADWLEPVLIRDQNATVKPGRQKSLIDIAPFARVVTGDPNRLSGCSASRVQEFFAEDVFPERDLCLDNDGSYNIAPCDGGKACIGLRWLENRSPTQVAIEFAEGSTIPSASKTHIEIWQGESPWQGEWKNQDCKIEQEGKRFMCSLRGVNDVNFKTRKIRWVFSELADPISIEGLSALCPVRFRSLELMAQFEREGSGEKADIELYNAEFDANSVQETKYVWATTQPAHLKLRVAKSGIADVSTGSILRVSSASGTTVVSLDDVLENGCVYVPQSGLYVAKGPNYLGLEEYKQRIANKKTILERVREMPDQTFEQAMEKTHNPIQNNGPMLLSLACDNSKFVSNRDAGINFSCLYGVESAGMKTTFGKVQNQQAERYLEGGWLPIPVVTAFSDGITYTQHTYVAPFDSSGDNRQWPYLCDRPICVAEYTIENKNGAASGALLSLLFYDKTKDAEPIQLVENQSSIVVHQKGCVLALVDLSEAIPLKGEISNGSIIITGELSRNGIAHCYVCIPAWGVKAEDSTMLAVKGNLRKEVKTHWEKVLVGTMEVEIPDSLLGNVVRASQVHCLLAARNEEDGRQIAAWISSDRYGPLESEAHSVIRGMNFFGHEKFAKQSLEYFIKRYNAAGFLTTGYTLMGTGWHLWTLAEYFDLTQDAPWLRSHESEIAKVCQWIVAQRQKTKSSDCSGQKVLEYGLMPPGVLADWNTFAYHYSLSGYYYAGLKGAAEALVAAGYGEATEFQKDAADFRDDIMRSYLRMQRLSPVAGLQNGTSVTSYPSQAYLCGPVANFFPGEDGNRSWCYDVELGASQLVPTGVLDPMAPETADMLEHMEDVQFLASGWGDYPAEKSKADWFNLGGFAKVQPYYCRNAEIYAMRDDIKPFIRSYFNSLASLLNTENLSLWEHFHNTGAWNKTHETGYFLHQTRTMLLTERGDALWLAPLITANWLKDGLSIKVKNAPTRFGKVSYQINSHINEGYIDVVIDSPGRKSPKELVLRLRHPEGKLLKQILVNNKPYQKFDCAKECIYLMPSSDKITVHAEF